MRAKFAPSQKKKWKSKFKKHFANRNARPWKTTEDDDPSLEEFRVRYELGSRSCGKYVLIDRAVARLSQMFSEDVTSRQEAGAAADAEASAPDHDVAVLGAPARSNATSPPDGASEETACKRQRKFGDRVSAIKYFLEPISLRNILRIATHDLGRLRRTMIRARQ